MSKQQTTGRMSLMVITDDQVEFVKSINDNKEIVSTTKKFSERLTLPEKGSGDVFYAIKLANKQNKVILNKEWETISVKV